MIWTGIQLGFGLMVGALLFSFAWQLGKRHTKVVAWVLVSLTTLVGTAIGEKYVPNLGLYVLGVAISYLVWKRLLAMLTAK